MSVDRLPTYSVAELNTAIGSLLERGFAPRFLLEATVSRPQLKKGHLWLTLTDGSASISGRGVGFEAGPIELSTQRR